MIRIKTRVCFLAIWALKMKERKLLWTLTQSISKHSAFGSPDCLTRDDPSNSILCCCSVAKLCLTLCDAMDCSRRGFPVLHCISEFAQTHIHCVNDAIQPSRSLLPHSLPTLNLSQHQPASPALAGGFFTTEPPGKPMLTTLNLPIYEYKYLPTYWAFSVSLSVLCFSVFMSYISLAAKYFVHFDAIANTIVLLDSLLVYINVLEFCLLILYPATMLNTFMSPSRLGRITNSLEFFCV